MGLTEGLGVHQMGNSGWDDMPHVWPMFASFLPEGQQAIDRIGEFIRKHTA